MYASSKCYFGINLKPLCQPWEVSYTLMPNMAFFEFLPVYCNKNEDAGPVTTTTEQPPELVDLVDVKVGQEYELVITTYSGLYRYRVGDVLRVTGFHNATPQFHFMCRKNVMLSIETNKTDEGELHNAVMNAVKHLEPLEATLVEFTSYTDTSTIPRHYVLYWEI